MAIKKIFEAAREWLGMRKPVHALPGSQAKFTLMYGEIVIGTLTVDGGPWRFTYSDEFKKDGSLRPLIEFPDPSQTYESEELWQFFASRIPSTEQPEVEAILKRENIAEDDAVGLLRRFGTRTINNPFQLWAA